MDDAASYATLALWKKSKREPVSDELAKEVLSKAIAVWIVRNKPKCISFEDMKPPDCEDNSWEPPTLTDFSGVEVDEFLESLPERQRLLARLLYAGESQAEAAQAMGITRQAVDELLKKVQKGLADWLK